MEIHAGVPGDYYRNISSRLYPKAKKRWTASTVKDMCTLLPRAILQAFAQYNRLKSFHGESGITNDLIGGGRHTFHPILKGRRSEELI